MGEPDWDEGRIVEVSGDRQPHPEGARIWEKVIELGATTRPGHTGVERYVNSISHLVTEDGKVVLPVDAYEDLLLQAGFEFKGVADGEHYGWHDQQRDQRDERRRRGEET